MKLVSLVILAAATSLLCGGCASTTFQPYVGGKPLVGDGGVPVNVDGVDVWIEGTPPRKFMVVGIIEDDRPGGRIPMGRRDSDIAYVAKENGGDAVIMKFDEREYRGNIGSGQAYTTGLGYGNAITSGYGTSTAVFRRQSRYYVIKYL